MDLITLRFDIFSLFGVIDLILGSTRFSNLQKMKKPKKLFVIDFDLWIKDVGTMRS